MIKPRKDPIDYCPPAPAHIKRTWVTRTLIYSGGRAELALPDQPGQARPTARQAMASLFGSEREVAAWQKARAPARQTPAPASTPADELFDKTGIELVTEQEFAKLTGDPVAPAPPAAPTTPAGPLTLEERIIEVLSSGPENTRSILKQVGGRQRTTLEALAELVRGEIVTITPGPNNSRVYSLAGMAGPTR